MKQFFNKFPTPMAGLMLGLLALGNTLASYGGGIRTVFGVIGGILWVLLTLKFVLGLDDLFKEFENPVIASVFATYSMGTMLLATYLVTFSKPLATVIWFFGLILNLAGLFYFTMKYVLNFKIKTVFPSWFIVYVGMAVASVTGKAFNPVIAQYTFYIAFVCYLVLIPIVLYRVFKVKEMPEPTLPTIAIIAAPGSLCLAGYMNAFETKNMLLFYFLLVLSQALYLFVLTQMPKLLKLKFYPSFSGFTFPFVISALALKLSVGFLKNAGMNVGILPTVVMIEELIALVFVLYVLFLYLRAIFVPAAPTREQKEVKAVDSKGN